MDKTMTPSKITTAGQIDKAVANYRALLEKHAREFNSKAVQTVLGQPELASDQLAVFRRRVEAISDMVVRHVKVDRSRSPQKMLDAIGRTQYTNKDVVKAMPKGKGDEVDVFFFKPDASAFDDNGLISDDNAEKEFDLRGLKPTDPYSLAAVNEVDPAFADEHPNTTHWRDADGRWCYAAFDRWCGERYVRVYRSGGGRGSLWFLAGVPK